LAKKGEPADMLKFKSLPPFAALATVALLGGGAEPAMAAAEIYFGQLTPTPGCSASTNGSDEGAICANSQTFTSGGLSFTATGFSDTFGTPSALTLKDFATQGAVESGLGENAAGAKSCTDVPNSSGPVDSTPCEIGINHSVKVTSNTAIVDVLIGSVQGPEQFQVWTANTVGGSLSQFTSTLSAATCTTGPDGAGECEVDLPTGTHAVGVLDLPATDNTQASDVLLTAVSVPAPLIGHGLLVLLAVGGVLFGGKFLEGLKKRHLHAA
jgi:hypothetical protein